jgi:hypothetical protein
MNMGDEFFNFLWHEIQAISDTDRNATYDLNIDDKASLLTKDNYWTTNATLTGMANYTIEIEMKSGLVIIIHGPKEIKYANKEKDFIIRGINRTASINLGSAQNSTIKYTYPIDGASVRMVKSSDIQKEIQEEKAKGRNHE